MGGHTHIHTHTAAAVQEGAGDEKVAVGLRDAWGTVDLLCKSHMPVTCLISLTSSHRKHVHTAWHYVGSTAKKPPKYYLLDWLRIEPHWFFGINWNVSFVSYFVRLILIFHIIPDLKLCCQLKSQNKLMLCSQTSNPQDVVFKASPKIPNMVYVSKMMSKTCVTFSLDGNGKAVDNMEPPVLIISLNF